MDSAAEIIERMRAVYVGCATFRDRGLAKSIIEPEGPPQERVRQHHPFVLLFRRNVGAAVDLRFEARQETLGPPEEWTRHVVWTTPEGTRTWSTLDGGRVEEFDEISGPLHTFAGVTRGASTTVPYLLLGSIEDVDRWTIPPSRAQAFGEVERDGEVLDIVGAYSSASSFERYWIERRRGVLRWSETRNWRTPRDDSNVDEPPWSVTSTRHEPELDPPLEDRAFVFVPDLPAAASPGFDASRVVEDLLDEGEESFTMDVADPSTGDIDVIVRVPGLLSFAVAARDYCAWCDAAPGEAEEEVRTARDLLARVLAEATRLRVPDGLETSEEPESGPADEAWNRVFRRMSVLAAPQYYGDASIAVSGDPDDAVTTGDLHDDLADVWRDLSRGFAAYDNERFADALWEWTTSFESHWGEHAVNALRVLHLTLTRGASETDV